MKRLFMLFIMLFSFSMTGFCMTTTDLSENSKHKTELFSFYDVVSVGLKADVSYQCVFEVPSVILGEKHIYTLHGLKNYTTPKSGVTICIRDKIRVV